MLIQALQKVFRRPTYLILALITSMAVFLFAVWLPNIRLIVRVLGSSDIPFLDRLELPLNLIGSIATNFTLLSASYTIAIALLFGINLAMVIYFLKRRIKEVEQSGIATGFLGIASGVLGMGCAACGSFLLTSILTFFGVSGILVYLPLAGGEFGILGVVLLAVSVYMTAKKIENPAVCKI
jgi:hypothetical protein